MKPSTENPASLYEAGQGRSLSKTIVLLSVLAVVLLVVVLTDGLVYSISGTSLLSEVFNDTEEVVYAYHDESDIGFGSFKSQQRRSNRLINLSGDDELTATTSPIATSTPIPTVAPTATPIATPVVTPKPTPKVYKLNKSRYIVAADGVNARKKPSKKSKSLKVLSFGKKIKCNFVNKKWAVVKVRKKSGKTTYAFVSRQYLSKHKPKCKIKSVYGDKRKSYEDYRCITSRSSPQYKLRLRSRTASNGIRTCNGRYLVALGSRYTTKIGRYFDLVLSNGTVIKCVLGDQKSNKDTINGHMLGKDGGCAEFIVETSALSRRTRQMGDCSYSHSAWRSKVVKVKLYNKSVF